MKRAFRAAKATRPKGRKRKAENMGLKFRLVDLSNGIRTSVAQMQAELAAMPPGSAISGVHGGMHLLVETVDGTVLVDAVPMEEQTIPNPIDPYLQPTYGDTVWGSCPVDLRGPGYHDPVRPGSTLQGDGGPDDMYVWVQDQGYVLASTVPGGAAQGPLVAAAHKAIDDLVNGIHAGAK